MIATDSNKTVVLFIYDDINWGENALIGFDAGDGYNSYVLTEAISPHTAVDISQLSNTGEAGVFIFHVDSELSDIVYDNCYGYTVVDSTMTVS